MIRRLTYLSFVCVALWWAWPIHAYLKLGTPVGGGIVQLRWAQGLVRYFVTNRDVPGVSAPQLEAAVARAFSTWAAVPTASVSADFVGFTSAEPVEGDGASVVAFEMRPDLEGVLGVTSFVVDDVTGDLLEADVVLNASYPWSDVAAGDPSRYDVESVVLHEVGHVLGLGHSALGETEVTPAGDRRVLAKRAVMFPIAYPRGNVEDRTLEADDVAGVSDIYGTPEFRRRSGSIRGRVTLDGVGVFGAHVVAFSLGRRTTVSGFTLTDDGDFVVAGLEPGLYVVRAEPLDDADVDGFFNGDAGVEVGFRPAYAERLVAVPRGGSAAPADIRVIRK